MTMVKKSNYRKPHCIAYYFLYFLFNRRNEICFRGRKFNVKDSYPLILKKEKSFIVNTRRELMYSYIFFYSYGIKAMVEIPFFFIFYFHVKLLEFYVNGYIVHHVVTVINHLHIY